MAEPTDVERAWEQVRLNPRDLEPRRHLARVLVSRGDPLGEFLTLVLAPEKEVPAGGYPRAEALFQRHGNEWFPRSPGEHPASKRDASMFVGRGVPESLNLIRPKLPATELIEWWAARYPLRHISFWRTEPSEALSLLERRGLFALLESLELRECTLTDAVVDGIANATAGPRSLQLTQCEGLDGARAERLFRGRGLASVTFLGIAAAPLEAPVMHAIWSGLPELERLRLYNVQLGKENLGLPQGVRRRWTEFTLEGSFTGSQGLESVRGLDLSVTRSLCLRGPGVPKEVLAQLRDAVRAGELQALRELDLQRIYICAEELAVLLEAPPPNLVHLDISSNSIGKEGLKALAAYARQSQTLKSLPLSDLNVGSGEMEESTEWEGSTYTYERNLTVEEIREKFGFPAALET